MLPLPQDHKELVMVLVTDSVGVRVMVGVFVEVGGTDVAVEVAVPVGVEVAVPVGVAVGEVV